MQVQTKTAPWGCTRDDPADGWQDAGERFDFGGERFARDFARLRERNCSDLERTDGGGGLHDNADGLECGDPMQDAVKPELSGNCQPISSNGAACSEGPALSLNQVTRR